MASEDKGFPVIELFGPTLQGEGASIGVQTMFVRFGGCDYKCTKCDSLHAVLPQLVKQNAKWLPTGDIVGQLVSAAALGECQTVTFSGGNPCMWDLTNLVHSLKTLQWEILVETQGTIWQDWLLDCTGVTVSPKGPGMGEKFEADKFKVFVDRFLDHPERRDVAQFSIKVVVFDQRDIEFAKHLIHIFPSIKYNLFLSMGNPWPPLPAEQSPFPTTPDLQLDLLDRMRMLYDEIKKEPLLKWARFLPQMHVLLWSNDRGR